MRVSDATLRRVPFGKPQTEALAQWRNLLHMVNIEQLLNDLSFQPIGEHNGIIKRIKGVISNTKPNPQKLFVAEGIWLASMCLKFGTHIECLVVCPEHIRTPEVAELIKNLSAKTPDRFSVSAKTYEKISEKGQPDGIMALAALPQRDIADFAPPPKAVILVIDGVEIPGNAGTMLRMADGAGADAVFFCNRKVRMTHPKLIKSSQGAVLTVPTFEFSTVEECRSWLKTHGFTVYLADTRAEKFYYDEPFGKNAALILGSERYGIAREWYDGDYSMIAIPMLGKCDSLNVGVAATVLTYEACIKNKLKK